MSTFHVINFGCRATQADGAAIERRLSARGLSRAEGDDASVVVINTCTVTAAADADARAAIRRVHRSNPAAEILVTGCYAQRAPDEIAKIPGVRWVIGNSHKDRVAELVSTVPTSGGPHAASPVVQSPQAGLEEPGVHSAWISLQEIAPSEHIEASGAMAEMLVGDIFAHTEVLAAPVFEGDASGFGRTRANLKVQDGCNNRCSFCIIPFVRGRSRSLDMDQVIAEAEQLVRAGFQELVLSGINLGRWGRDLTRRDTFTNLLRYLLRRTGVSKLRISSVEPMDWTDELIQLVATEPRIAKHAHLPLQSGSDRVLRMMHRKYRPWHYEEKIRKIRAAMPEAAIGADVMVGFPGETDALFQETYDFIERLPFTYLHVFTFSARPGTPAAAMQDQVPAPVARGRNRLLRELIAGKNADFRRQFVGRRIHAITLARADQARWTQALTDNFLKMSIAGAHAPNRWVAAEVVGLTADGLTARLT